MVLICNSLATDLHVLKDSCVYLLNEWTLEPKTRSVMFGSILWLMWWRFPRRSSVISHVSSATKCATVMSSAARRRWTRGSIPMLLTLYRIDDAICYHPMSSYTRFLQQNDLLTRTKLNEVEALIKYSLLSHVSLNFKENRQINNCIQHWFPENAVNAFIMIFIVCFRQNSSSQDNSHHITSAALFVPPRLNRIITGIQNRVVTMADFCCATRSCQRSCRLSGLFFGGEWMEQTTRCQCHLENKLGYTWPNQGPCRSASDSEMMAMTSD